MAVCLSAKQKEKLEANYGLAFTHASRDAGPLLKRIKVWQAAKDVYSPGDTSEQLQDKIVHKLGFQVGAGAFDWLALIQKLLPIILQILAMFGV